jgi:hypothetical protein
MRFHALSLIGFIRLARFTDGHAVLISAVFIRPIPELLVAPLQSRATK